MKITLGSSYYNYSTSDCTALLSHCLMMLNIIVKWFLIASTNSTVMPWTSKSGWTDRRTKSAILKCFPHKAEDIINTLTCKSKTNANATRVQVCVFYVTYLLHVSSATLFWRPYKLPASKHGSLCWNIQLNPSLYKTLGEMALCN